jgi:hypothetical protein
MLRNPAHDHEVTLTCDPDYSVHVDAMIERPQGFEDGSERILEINGTKVQPIDGKADIR